MARRLSTVVAEIPHGRPEEPHEIVSNIIPVHYHDKDLNATESKRRSNGLQTELGPPFAKLRFEDKTEF